MARGMDGVNRRSKMGLGMKANGPMTNLMEEEFFLRLMAEGMKVNLKMKSVMEMAGLYQVIKKLFMKDSSKMMFKMDSVRKLKQDNINSQEILKTL